MLIQKSCLGISGINYSMCILHKIIKHFALVQEATIHDAMGAA